jgi:hypothetical protein
MAYMKNLKRMCGRPGCLKLATVEVFNAKNAPLGYFCKKCANRVYARALKAEAPAPVLETPDVEAFAEAHADLHRVKTR